VHVDARKGRGRQARERNARILVEHATALAETCSLELVVDDGGPLAPNLQADQAQLGGRRESLEHEAAAARPNL
jgi:hypothetical protein